MVVSRSQQPGPRGVRLHQYKQLEAAGGVAPAGWTFDKSEWWLEEHGLIMEKPDFPIPPGRSAPPPFATAAITTAPVAFTTTAITFARYAVTGDREVTTTLTVEPGGAWKLDAGTLYDVTHLPCRSAR